jgi:hypothetical protein
MSGTHHDHEDHEKPVKPRKGKRVAARRRLSIRQDRTALPGALAVCGFLRQYVDTPDLSEPEK